MNDLAIFYDHLTEAALQEGCELFGMLRRARDTGYDSVNIMLSTLDSGEEAMKLLGRSGLGVNSVCCFTSFGERPAEEEKKEALRVLSVVEGTGCCKLMSIPGFLKTEEEKRRGSAAYLEKRERMAEILCFLTKEAAKRGVTVLMEDFDGDQAPFCTGEELLWFLDRVEGLKCAFDTGNFMYADQEAAALLPAFLPKVADVHLKDRGLEENGSEVKVSIGGRKLYAVPVGSGVIPIREMMETLLRAGYTGAFAAEHYGSSRQAEDMVLSARFIKGVCGAFR